MEVDYRASGYQEGKSDGQQMAQLNNHDSNMGGAVKISSAAASGGSRMIVDASSGGSKSAAAHGQNVMHKVSSNGKKSSNSG